MSRFTKLREKLYKYRGTIISKPIKGLDREIERSGN